MNRLNKMGAEVLAQSIENEEISKHFSSGLKDKMLKLGASALLAATLVTSSGFAQADNTLIGVLGAGAVAGVVTSGSRPDGLDCGQGTSGWKVGTMTAIGGGLGSLAGQGTGRTIMTVAGALLGGTVAQSSENDRIRNECANYSRSPKYNSKTSLPSGNILYEGARSNGGTYFVTVADSVGMAGLTGKRVGQLDVNSDPMVMNALERSSSSLVIAYDELDASAHNYMNIVAGKTTTGKISRYAVDDNEIARNSVVVQEQQRKIAEAKMKFNAAYEKYSAKRSVFANIADNAATDNFNITPYAPALPYFTPPQSAHTVSVTENNGYSYNKYAFLPGAIKP